MRFTPSRRPLPSTVAATVAALVVAAALPACSNDDDDADTNMFDGSTPVNVTSDTLGDLGTAPGPQTTVVSDTTVVGPGGTGTTAGDRTGTSAPAGSGAPMGATVDPGVGANTPGAAGTTPVTGNGQTAGGSAVPDSPGGAVAPDTSASTGSARGGAAVSTGVADTPATRGAFCNALVGVDAALGSSPPVNDTEALKALAARVEPLVDTLQETAPTPVAGAVQTIADALAEVADDGDATALGTPSFRLASGVLGRWVHERCGFQQVEVVAHDGGFRGLPARLRSGTTSFRVRNTGQQEHVLVVARKKPGVADAPLAILRSGAESALNKIVTVTAVYVAKGEQSEGTAVLSPGSYFAFCDVAGADGRPHYLDGAIATFTVR